MRALDVATFGYAENLGVKQWAKFSFATSITIQQLKNSSNNENTEKELLFGWRFGKSSVWSRELLRKLKITSRPSLSLYSSDSTPKLKTNMVKPRKRRFHFIESDSVFSRTLNFLCPKDVKISLYIIVLIVRGCFDRTQNVTCRVWINYFGTWCARFASV